MLKKKMLRDIKENNRQFIAIFLMSFITLLAFAGIGSEVQGLQNNLDNYYNETNMADAYVFGEDFNKSLMKDCRNGLFWLDIHSKFPDIEPIPTKRLTPFADIDVTKKQRELLEEIITICSNNGIKYVVGPDLARRMFMTGNIGYTNSNREIFMDEENAARFESAFRNCDKQERSLISWKDSRKVKDMAMLYCDKGSVYCDFRDLEKWRDTGTCITIRILGNGAGLTGLKCRLLGRDAEKIQSEDLCYYTNVRGKRPVRHAFKHKLWEETCEIEMSGVVYTIPKAMTAKYVHKETDLGNVPPINSIFMYRSSDMSWDEISPLIDDAAYKALNWDKYFAARKQYRKIDGKVRGIWQTMLDIGNRYEQER